MPAIDLRTRFAHEFKSDIRDPILTALLRSLEVYQNEYQDELLYSIYAQRSDEISDGLFEVLRRHLFGQMYPGPVFTIVEATLREAEVPVAVELHHESYSFLSDTEGNKILFAPLSPVWIVPANTNEVTVESDGSDLLLGFSLIPHEVAKEDDVVASVFLHQVSPLLAERMRCRIFDYKPTDIAAKARRTVLRDAYPGTFNFIDDFFVAPSQWQFLEIPMHILKSAKGKDNADQIWLRLPGLGTHASELKKKLTLNAFLTWNVERRNHEAVPIDNVRYKISLPDPKNVQLTVVSVADAGQEVEYVDAAMTTEPAYPYQFTASVDSRRGDILLSFNPPPTGSVKATCCQFRLDDTSVGIAAGESMKHYEGLDERILSMQSLMPTQRLDVVNNKKRVWDYFRSLLASRNRWLTRDDLRAAVKMFPPFAGTESPVNIDRIGFEEKVGRVRGFLTPYTEIKVVLAPSDESNILADTKEKSYFERRLGAYLKSRTVNGNFVQARLMTVEGA
jgi:hypothetical protein